MKYVDISGRCEPAGKYLGIYEMELRPAVESLISCRPRRIINIGAADGYYAIGLLLRLPSTRLVAFEADPDTRSLLEAMAKLNSVTERISVRGYCDIGSLRAAIEDGNAEKQDPPWLVVDIEGGEKDLLDPTAIPGLRQCPILVELHDCLIQGCYETVRQRFMPTHQITEFQSLRRTLADLPSFGGLPLWRLRRIIRERGDVPMTWLWMWPFSQGASPLSKLAATE